MSINKLESHTYRLYEEELAEVRSRFMEMAGNVENQLENAVKALDKSDPQIAEAVIAREALVDQMEVELEQSCTQIIALRAPTASDLRSVLGTMRCVRELERIGDESKKIAGITLELLQSDTVTGAHNETRHLSKGAKRMLNDAVDAFARMDPDKALDVLSQDDDLDADYASAIRELITYMMEDPRNITRSINVLWVLRSLERIGDHAKNICEAIVYIVRGKDIRHGNIDSLND